MSDRCISSHLGKCIYICSLSFVSTLKEVDFSEDGAEAFVSHFVFEVAFNEDLGEEDNEDSWGLGTQYWIQHPHVAGYKPLFGILLDMVGAADATFTREYYSTQYAGGFVDLVWKQAAGSHFINAQGGAVTDDHVFVNRGGIPCIDIIDMRSDTDTGFCPVWHTVDDTMNSISASTLAEVGQTLLNVIAALQQ